MPVISIENAEGYNWGENCIGWHLVKSKDLSVIQESVQQGSTEVKHYHQKSEQFFYVLSGIATIDLEGHRYQLKPKQGLHIDPGKAHQLSNQHTQELMFLVISTPPSHGDRVLV